jgi:predicted MFS family arabinose efflux permease
MMVLMTLWSPMARIGRGGVRYYRDIPAPVRVLSAGMLINRAGGFFNSFLPLILAARGLSTREVGAALVVTGAAAVAGAWLGGIITARVGSRMVIAAALFSSAVFTACLIPASPYPVLIGIARMNAVSSTTPSGMPGSMCRMM